MPVEIDGRLYELSFVATGEVRDADGNLIQTVETEPIVIDVEQAFKLMEGIDS